jgi:hypothetical protein
MELEKFAVICARQDWFGELAFYCWSTDFQVHFHLHPTTLHDGLLMALLDCSMGLLTDLIWSLTAYLFWR